MLLGWVSYKHLYIYIIYINENKKQRKKQTNVVSHCQGLATSPQVTMVLSDSMLPPGTSQDDTLLPCSPSQLLNTDVAIATLKSVDQRNTAV